MAEQFTREQRSAVMRAVKSRGTSAETRLVRILDEIGAERRTHARDLPGQPDFVLDKFRIALFVDGDFWHGRPWLERGEAPIQNRAYWIAKFERNAERDARTSRLLRRHGWSVVRIWESELIGLPDAVQRNLRRLIRLRRTQEGGQ
jgi:DNA mismatch endonuclease (patch repair protein)